jgi:hypothetical protein
MVNAVDVPVTVGIEGGYENNLDEIIEPAKKNANRNCRDQD